MLQLNAILDDIYVYEEYNIFWWLKCKQYTVNTRVVAPLFNQSKKDKATPIVGGFFNCEDFIFLNFNYMTIDNCVLQLIVYLSTSVSH